MGRSKHELQVFRKVIHVSGVESGPNSVERSRSLVEMRPELIEFCQSRTNSDQIGSNSVHIWPYTSSFV